jgi:hypothetical protein
MGDDVVPAELGWFWGFEATNMMSRPWRWSRAKHPAENKNAPLDSVERNGFG